MVNFKFDIKIEHKMPILTSEHGANSRVSWSWSVPWHNVRVEASLSEATIPISSHAQKYTGLGFRKTKKENHLDLDKQKFEINKSINSDSSQQLEL